MIGLGGLARRASVRRKENSFPNCTHRKARDAAAKEAREARRRIGERRDWDDWTQEDSEPPLGALLSSPALDVRLPTALQVLQVLHSTTGVVGAHTERQLRWK